jgi:hypothetical protein
LKAVWVERAAHYDRLARYYPNFRSWTTKTTPAPLFSGADFPKLALQISDSFWDPQPLGKFQAQMVEQDRLRLVGTHHAPQHHGAAIGGR